MKTCTLEIYHLLTLNTKKRNIYKYIFLSFRDKIDEMIFVFVQNSE